MPAAKQSATAVGRGFPRTPPARVSPRHAWVFLPSERPGARRRLRACADKLEGGAMSGDTPFGPRRAHPPAQVAAAQARATPTMAAIAALTGRGLPATGARSR